MRRAIAMTAAAVLLAGCGNERTPVPDVRHAAAPEGSREVELEAAGVSFRAPVNWQDLPAEGQRVGGIRSNTATLAVWHYPRTEPLPESRDDLRAARARLEARVRERDATFELRASEVTRRAGAPAIELLGRQTIAGIRFGVRSSHVYAAGAEYVIDAYALPEDFERVDATVFQPVLESLRLRSPGTDATASPTPSASPTATPTPSPTPAASPASTASPTPMPTATPTVTPLGKSDPP